MDSELDVFLAHYPGRLAGWARISNRRRLARKPLGRSIPTAPGAAG
jgi:hypothetical protein